MVKPKPPFVRADIDQVIARSMGLLKALQPQLQAKTIDWQLDAMRAERGE